MKCLILFIALCAFALPALAVDSEPPFADATLQARYENLIHQFRCLVCQDEDIANSDADLAADFRRQIHAMVARGKSDQQIKQYMVNRYGDFVLYKPPLQTNTWLLWTGPFLLLLIALIALALILRRRARMDETGRAGP